MVSQNRISSIIRKIKFMGMSFFRNISNMGITEKVYDKLSVYGRYNISLF